MIVADWGFFMTGEGCVMRLYFFSIVLSAVCSCPFEFGIGSTGILLEVGQVLCLVFGIAGRVPCNGAQVVGYIDIDIGKPYLFEFQHNQ